MSKPLDQQLSFRHNVQMTSDSTHRTGATSVADLEAIIERATSDPEARRQAHESAREELRRMKEEEGPHSIVPNQGLTMVEREAEEDALDRGRLTQSLVQLVRERDNDKPLAIGLFGHWGAGKSSQIGFVKKALSDESKGRTRIVDFNAWEYERCGNIAAALAQSVVDALLRDVGLGGQIKLAVRMAALRRSRVGTTVANLLERRWAALRVWFLGGLPALWPACLMLFVLLLVVFSPDTALNGFARTVATSLTTVITVLVGVVTSSKLVTGSLTEWFKGFNVGSRLQLFRLPDYEAQLGVLHDIRVTLANLCSLQLGTEPVAGEKTDTLLILIDDLDRCSPKTVKEVFDAVRLVANIPRVVTMLAIDDRIAFAAVEKHYDQFGFAGREPGQVARDYLAKVFQASLSLPPISAAAASSYVHKELFSFDTDEVQPTWDKDFYAVDGNGPGPSTSDFSSGETEQKPMPVALEAEARLFWKLANESGITNPRELWRMKQAWFILKALVLESGARMEEMRPLLQALFMREWFLRSSVQVRQRIESWLDAAGTSAEVTAPDGSPEAAYVAWLLEYGDLSKMADIVLLPGAPLHHLGAVKDPQCALA